jgi:hypothetical protein
MEWWAILASIIGTVGGILGVFSFARTIKRQRPRFNIKIDRPGILYGEVNKAEFLVIDTTISNLSDIANSIVEYGLIIGHPYSVSTEPIHYSENKLGESILETADMSKRLAVKRTRFDWLETPVNLSPHSSASGFIGFPLPSIPRTIVKSIDYTLIIIPSEGPPSLLPLGLDTFDWNIAKHTITRRDATSSGN